MPGEEQIENVTEERTETLLEVDALPKEIVTGAVYSIRQANPNSYTHGMFKYPCKFIPEIPRWAMRVFLEQPAFPQPDGEVPLVFDPFAGSGTTLLEANLIGFDGGNMRLTILRN